MVLSSLFLYFSCSSLFYYPSRHIYPVPPNIQPYSQDFFFKSKDSVLLHGRFFSSGKNTRGTLLQFHGNSENLTTHSLGVTWILRYGYNLFTFDYRGYGQSNGTPSPEGIRQDALSALEKAQEFHQQHTPQGQFILLGQSLGGAIAMRAAQDFPTKNLIKLMILDSSFHSYQEIAFKKLASHWSTWLLSPLAYVLVSDKTSTELRSFQLPILIIHSKNDPVVPFSCSHSIYAGVSSSKKTFWVGQEEGHTLAFFSQNRQKRFVEFLSSI